MALSVRVGNEITPENAVPSVAFGSISDACRKSLSVRYVPFAEVKIDNLSVG